MIDGRDREAVKDASRDGLIDELYHANYAAVLRVPVAACRAERLQRQRQPVPPPVRRAAALDEGPGLPPCS